MAVEHALPDFKLISLSLDVPPQITKIFFFLAPSSFDQLFLSLTLS